MPALQHGGGTCFFSSPSISIGHPSTKASAKKRKNRKKRDTTNTLLFMTQPPELPSNRSQGAQCGSAVSTSPALFSMTAALARTQRATEILGLSWPAVAGFFTERMLLGNDCSTNERSDENYFSVACRSVTTALSESIWNLGVFAYRAAVSVGAAHRGHMQTRGSHSALRAMSETTCVAYFLNLVAEAISADLFNRTGSASQHNVSSALTLLQRSASICDERSLAKALDLLRGAELVRATLSRAEDKKDFAGAHGPVPAAALSSTTTKRSSTSAVFLYPEWDRGDGLLLPVAQTLRVVTLAVVAEIKDREALRNVGMLYPCTMLIEDRGLKSFALLGVLTEHGASKLSACFQITEVSSMHELYTLSHLELILQAVAEAAVTKRRVDFGLALGAIVALPQRGGFRSCDEMAEDVMGGAFYFA